MPNCDARWGPMGPMGPDCAVPPAKCVIIHVAPLIIMCVQTAFGNLHTHAHLHSYTDALACSFVDIVNNFFYFVVASVSSGFHSRRRQ